MTPDERRTLAETSLEGLSVGDAFGERYAYGHEDVRTRVARESLHGNWRWTDDTAMALGIMECLNRCGKIEEEILALTFARNFKRDYERGYGRMAARILERINEGDPWEAVSRSAFNGGSMGNGAAMRVAPLGAWFADDLDRVAEEGVKSSRVTHWHEEGIAGSVAVAIATAVAWQTRDLPATEARAIIAKELRHRTPEGETANGIELALALDPEALPFLAARRLGNGSLVTSPDTVPYVVWCTLRSLDDYAEALIATVEGGGDCDTNAAMVGGILAARLGMEAIPHEWREAREALPAFS